MNYFGFFGIKAIINPTKSSLFVSVCSSPITSPSTLVSASINGLSRCFNSFWRLGNSGSASFFFRCHKRQNPCTLSAESTWVALGFPRLTSLFES